MPDPTIIITQQWHSAQHPTVTVLNNSAYPWSENTTPERLKPGSEATIAFPAGTMWVPGRWVTWNTESLLVIQIGATNWPTNGHVFIEFDYAVSSEATYDYLAVVGDAHTSSTSAYEYVHDSGNENVESIDDLTWHHIGVDASKPSSDSAPYTLTFSFIRDVYGTAGLDTALIRNIVISDDEPQSFHELINYQWASSAHPEVSITNDSNYPWGENTALVKTRTYHAGHIPAGIMWPANAKKNTTATLTIIAAASASAPIYIHFDSATSSETNKDKLTVSVNDIVNFVESGQEDITDLSQLVWTSHTLTLVSQSTVTFVYSKDASSNRGFDRAFLRNLVISDHQTLFPIVLAPQNMTELTYTLLSSVGGDYPWAPDNLFETNVWSSTNTGTPGRYKTATASLSFNASASGMLSLKSAVSCEDARDLYRLYHGSEMIFERSGNESWSTAEDVVFSEDTVNFSSGESVFVFSYTKDASRNRGLDRAMISQVLIGDIDVATVTFVSSIGTAPSPSHYPIGTVIAAGTFPSMTAFGYAFLGWYLDPDFETSAIGYTINDAITVYAKWRTFQLCTITYVTEVGETPAPQVVESGNTFSGHLPSLYVGSFYTHQGWYYDSSFTTKVNATDTISQDVTVYAKWSMSFYEGEGRLIAIEFNKPVEVADGAEDAFRVTVPVVAGDGITEPLELPVVFVQKHISLANTIVLGLSSALTVAPNYETLEMTMGDATVRYLGGYLVGEDGEVLNFEETFTPVLSRYRGNASHAEHIDAADVDYSGTLTQIYWVSQQTPIEHVEAAAATWSGTLTHVDDI